MLGECSRRIEDHTRKPGKRATAYSPRRVREPWVCAAPILKPAEWATASCRIVWERLTALEVSVARYAGLSSYRLVPRARGLALGYMPSPAMRACSPNRCWTSPLAIHSGLRLPKTLVPLFQQLNTWAVVDSSGQNDP
jgi:hypothetical protein